MKKLIILSSVLIFVQIAFAMEIIPPEMVLRQVIKSATSMKLPRQMDLKKIRMANSNYTEKAVSALFLTLNTDELEIQGPERMTDLNVHVIAPRRVDFLFEERHSKWVDGADYTYYVIISIEERTSQPAGGAYGAPAAGAPSAHP